MKKRIFVSLLCSLLLMPTVIGCASDTTDAIDTQNSDSASDSIASETEDARDSADLPDKDFGGAEFRILAEYDWNPAGSGVTLIVPDEMNGDVLNDEVFERNSALMDKYNFTFRWTADREAHTIIQNCINGGIDDYDLLAADFIKGMRNAIANVYLELNEIPYISLEKDYWNPHMQRELSIGEKVYAVCGDITFMEEDALMVTLFNKPMAETYDMENLYDTVRSGKWTIDKMKECMAQVVNDLNGDGKFDHENDIIGLLYAGNSTLSPYMAAANTTLNYKDDKDIPHLTADLSAAESIYSTMQEIFTTGGYALEWMALPEPVANMASMIDGKRVLFQNMITSFLRRNYRDVEADFGILPMPKFSEEQDQYSTLYNPKAMSLGFVPASVVDTEKVGFILEAMADASENLSKIYFDVCLSGKYTRDPESYEMIRLAEDNIVMDMTFMFDFGTLGTLLTDSIKAKPFVSTFESKKAAAEQAIAEFFANIQ